MTNWKGCFGCDGNYASVTKRRRAQEAFDGVPIFFSVVSSATVQTADSTQSFSGTEFVNGNWNSERELMLAKFTHGNEGGAGCRR